MIGKIRSFTNNLVWVWLAFISGAVIIKLFGSHAPMTGAAICCAIIGANKLWKQDVKDLSLFFWLLSEILWTQIIINSL